MSRNAAAAGPDGLILIDKPSGPTSFDVIRRLRRLSGIRKFGHAGTLDPMASGLLMVCANRGTRLVPYLMDAHKRYVAEATLGVATDTADAEGSAVATGSLDGVDEAAIRSTLAAMVGDLVQRPPRYSALKVDGRRAYELARAGEAFELEARTVRIDAIEVIEVELPRVRFVVDCGKGTYIRSIAESLGETLGCYAHLSALRRTRTGGHDAASAVDLETLEAAGAEGFAAHLVPLFEALEGVATTLEVDEARAVDLVHGRTRFLEDLEPGTYRVTRPGPPRLVAIVERSSASERPSVKVFE